MGQMWRALTRRGADWGGWRLYLNRRRRCRTELSRRRIEGTAGERYGNEASATSRETGCDRTRAQQTPLTTINRAWPVQSNLASA